MAALRRLLERRAAPLSRRTQLLIVGFTSVGLIVATIWAWRSLSLSLSEIRWWPIALAFFVVAPATLYLKMLEYDAAARVIGSHAPWRRALDVAVVSSAANLLPIPGSFLVTTRSLAEQGATYGSAAVASSIPGLAWLALACLIGGAAIALAGAPVVGVLVFAGGVVGAVAALAMFRRTAPPHGRFALATRIVLIEAGWVALSGLRFWLLLYALDVSATGAQALALAVAGAMSVAIGFFPGGLGVREGLIALLSPLVDLRFSEGLVLGVLDRVIWLTFLSLAAVVVAAGRAHAARAARGADSAGDALEDRGQVVGEHGV